MKKCTHGQPTHVFLCNKDICNRASDQIAFVSAAFVPFKLSPMKRTFINHLFPLTSWATCRHKDTGHLLLNDTLREQRPFFEPRKVLCPGQVLWHKITFTENASLLEFHFNFSSGLLNYNTSSGKEFYFLRSNPPCSLYFSTGQQDNDDSMAGNYYTNNHCRHYIFLL